MLEECEVLPLRASPAGEDQRYEGGPCEGDAADWAAHNCAPDTGRAQSRTYAHAQSHDDVRCQVDEADQEAAGKKEGLQAPLGYEHVLVAECAEPLALGEEPNDWVREQEHEQCQSEESSAEPETAGRSWEPDLPHSLGRTATFERIKRPVPLAHE